MSADGGEHEQDLDPWPREGADWAGPGLRERPGAWVGAGLVIGTAGAALTFTGSAWLFVLGLLVSALAAVYLLAGTIALGVVLASRHLDAGR